MTGVVCLVKKGLKKYLGMGEGAIETGQAVCNLILSRKTFFNHYIRMLSKELPQCADKNCKLVNFTD